MNTETKPRELKCPRCNNTGGFQTEGHNHRCCACGKFFHQRVEITTTAHRNRVFNGPFGIR